MSPMREILFDFLLNALLQIALFAVIAASFSHLFAKAKAKYQYIVYLAVFLVCLTVPTINTFWKSSQIAAAGHSVQQISSEAGAAVAVSGTGRASRASTSNSYSGNRAKVGSSVYGECWSCID